MSLTSWLRHAQSHADSSSMGLPEPRNEFEAGANIEVRKLLDSNASPVNKKTRQPRGTDISYTPEVRLRIAKHSAIYGNKNATRKFSLELKHSVSESTVRGMKYKYLSELKTRKENEPMTSLPHKLRGKPLKLGSMGKTVQSYITKLRSAGANVNRSIAIATAKGVVKAQNPSLLTENGGSMDLGRKWAESLFKRMNFVKQKATKAARKVPNDFEQLKTEFIRKVHSRIKGNPEEGLPPIPFELILNWDQTGSKLVPMCVNGL